MTLPEGAPVDLGFEQFTRRAELELQFITALSNARAQDMRTASVEEHVVNQRLTNFTKAKSLEEFERDIRRFNSESLKHRAEVARIQMHATNLNFYRLGARLPSVVRQNLWAAYLFFMQRCPISVIAGWQARQLAGEFGTNEMEFKSPGGQPTKLTDLVFSGPIKNAHQLIEFQYDNRNTIMLRSATPSHTLTCVCFAEFSATAAADVAELKKAIDELRRGTYDLWKPQELVKLQDYPVT